MFYMTYFNKEPKIVKQMISFFACKAVVKFLVVVNDHAKKKELLWHRVLFSFDKKTKEYFTKHFSSADFTTQMYIFHFAALFVVQNFCANVLTKAAFF